MHFVLNLVEAASDEPMNQIWLECCVDHCNNYLLLMQPKPMKDLNGQLCQICGEIVGVTTNGDIFVACNECAFPICRVCYEYERKDGNQACPQCKTRYKRHKG